MPDFYYRCPFGHFEGSISGSFPNGDAPCPRCGTLLWPVFPPSSAPRVRLERIGSAGAYESAEVMNQIKMRWPWG